MKSGASIVRACFALPGMANCSPVQVLLSSFSPHLLAFKSVLTSSLFVDPLGSVLPNEWHTLLVSSVHLKIITLRSVSL